MRRISTALGLAALAGVTATVGLAAPAHASATSSSGYVLYATYGWGDQCNGIGSYGQQQGKWQFWYCDMIAPSGADGPGDYALYVSY